LLLAPTSRLHLVTVIAWITFLCVHGIFLSETAYPQIDQLIDREVQRQHVQTGQEFAPECSDEALVRRLYLDLTGTVPTPDQLSGFLRNQSPEKRNELIDELLEAPSFGIRLADTWDVELCHPKLEWPMIPFTNWLQKQFNGNRSWDSLAYELLTATGPQYKKPAVTVFFGMDKNYTLSPEDATDLVGRAFMGIKLECAQCHDHPYAGWTREQYWKIASLLGRTQLVSGWPNMEDLPARDDRESVGTFYGVKNSAAPSWRYKPPERSLQFPPTYPDERGGLIRAELAREAFADWLLWLLEVGFPYLSRAFVNRTWHHLFGCGFVSPVDDHRASNPPLYPQLQASLTDEFRKTGYDIKQLFGGICRSRTYQQESRTHEDPRNLSGINIRTVSPNQIFDMLHSILGDEAVSNVRGILGRRGARRRFLRFFGDDAAKGRPDRFSKSMLDFLQMLNSYQLEGGIRRRIESRKELWNDSSKMIDELYELTLSRLPSVDEKVRMTEFVKKSPSVDEGYRGVLWALINTGEFFLVQ